MLAAAAARTMGSPAPSRVVADLGGTQHYGWVATSALLLASAVTVHMVGKP